MGCFFFHITSDYLIKPFAQTSTSAFRKRQAAAFRVHINWKFHASYSHVQNRIIYLIYLCLLKLYIIVGMSIYSDKQANRDVEYSKRKMYLKLRATSNW